MLRLKTGFISGMVILLLAVMAGCGSKTRVSDETADNILDEKKALENDFAVALIDSSRAVNISDLFKRINASSMLRSGGILDSSTYFDTLQSIILDTIISLEAKNMDLSRDFNLYWLYSDRFRSLYIEYLYRKLILDSLKADSAQVDSFYLAHPEKFTLKEQVHIRHLMIAPAKMKSGPDSALYWGMADAQLDSVARVQIDDLAARVKAGEDLGTLARQYSMHEESREIGGDLGFIGRGMYILDFEKAVFALDSGQISEPFRSNDGWHIAEALERIDSGLVKLEGRYYDIAEKDLKTEFARNRSLFFIDSLYQDAQFEFNDSALMRPVLEVAPETWAATVNVNDTIWFVRLPIMFADFQKQRGLDSLSLTDKHEAMKIIARPLLIIRAGDELGYGDDEEVVAQKQELWDKYTRAMVIQEGESRGYVPPDSLIEDYYNKNIEKYIIKKPVKVQHIIVEDSLFGEFLRDQALSGIDFLDLAQEHYPGAQEIRRAAADLGYIGPDEMSPEFYDAAMRTPVGDISHPVKTEWGYHIIKVLDKKLNLGLDQVRGEISTLLIEENAKAIKAAWRERLLSKHNVTYFLDKAARLNIASLKERRK